MLQPVIESFDAHPITTLKANDGSLWFLAKDLAPALGVGRNTVRMQVADLEPVDVRVNTIDTNKGSRKSTFVSESGALQIIVQSRKPTARRLRKWVCDLALRYAKGVDCTDTLQPGPYAAQLLQVLGQVTQALTRVTETQNQLVNQVAQMTAQLFPSPQTGRGRRPRNDVAGLPRWSLDEHSRLKAQGYCTAADILAERLGRTPTNAEVTSLHTRTAAYCRAHGLPVKYVNWRNRRKAYLDQMALFRVLKGGKK